MSQAPVQTKREIVPRLREHERQLRDLGVKRIGLFGSFVHGRQVPESDVELVTIEALGPYLGPHILSETEDLLAAA